MDDTIVRSGIYVILNLVNGKVYIGSSVDVVGRLACHKIELARGKHGNMHLQSAWNKHGAGAFSFDVLKECPEDELLEQEQFHMDVLDSMNPAMGYNSRGADRQGVMRQEVRNRIRASNKGQKRSTETCARMSVSARRKFENPAAREALRILFKGKPLQPEHRAKKRAAQQTPEYRAKISASHKGVPLSPGHRASLVVAWSSPERRKRASLALKGRRLSVEARNKMSAARKGVLHSPEHKNRIADGVRRSWEFRERKQSRETRAKISASLKGRSKSFATRHRSEGETPWQL